MIFYIVLLLLILLLTNLLGERQRNGCAYLFVSIGLMFIAAIRFDVGWDYPIYYTAIELANPAVLSRFEPLNLLIISFAIRYEEPFLFFIISSLIIYTLTFYSFKRFSVNPAIALIVYLGIFYLPFLSVVRQALAVSICLFSYKYLYEKSFIRYSICILIATLFHYSAAISLVIFFIYHWINVKQSLLIAVSLLLLKSIVLSALEYLGIYSDYLSSLDDLSGGGLTRLFYPLLCFSFIFLYKLRKSEKDELKLLSVIIIGLVFPFLFGSTMGERLCYYFIVYYCYLIPLLLQKIPLFVKNIYVLLFSGYFLFMIYFTSNIPGQKSAYTPYKTIFDITNISFKF